MPDWTIVNRSHVLAAIRQCDHLESRDFVARFGFRGVHGSTLWHQGGEYDAAAILGLAHVEATGRPVTKDELPGGQEGVAETLRTIGFDVIVEEPPVVSARPRAAAPAKAAAAKTTSPKAAPGKASTTKAAAAKPAPKKRVVKPEPVVNICPRCYMAIPATGICDNCD
ncbi:hypothetical protein BH10ACT10_BH10ACT10_06720 [soil metagenome]